MTPRTSLGHNYAGYCTTDGLLLLCSPTPGPEGAYQNVPDPDLRDWRRAYYGDNYPRLVDVKSAYDPTDFFTYPEGIGSRQHR